LKKLDSYNRDFFVVFAHVEAASGLWNELHGGRMEELAQQPLVQKYCLGFQKVRTHDKPGAKCRVQVQKWWGGGYPAEVEGSDLPRHNIRKETYQTLAEAYADFTAIYKDLDKAAAYANGKAETFKDIFLERLGELLTFQVPNSYDVSYHGKPLRSHSLGQRASAMMLFLLSQDDSDLLLVDQPEDDLDSQTVYEEVVKLLRAIKARQQFIFATHNANFPVLGDAELVTACRQQDDKILVDNGSIDTKACQGKIVDILEGGAEAFERRKTIYQAWKSSVET
jgi:chromosome segregation protein